MFRFFCMRNFIIILFSAFLLSVAVSCGHAVPDTVTAGNNLYARGFSLSDCDGYKILDIRNPWDTLRLLHRYLLVPKGAAIPDSMPQGTLLRTPLGRVAVYASQHCAVMSRLGVEGNVAGICDAYYVADTVVKKRLKQGEIVDLGSSFLPDMERLVSLSAEAIILSPYKDGSYGKTGELGIPLVEIADYMENSPLARAEWIKVFGALFDCGALADSAFSVTCSRYDSLAAMAAVAVERPTLFCELKTGGVWYQPCGESYMAALYRDAGIDYLWSDTPGTGSLSLSFEEVLSRAVHADLWVFKYADETRDRRLSDLAREFAPYSGFDAFKNGGVWGCNSVKSPFFEDLAVSPDRVLHDFMLMAHPELFSADDTAFYFKRLEK